MTLKEARERYGEIVDDKWKNETKWMILYTLPAFVTNWKNIATQKPLKKVYINKDIILNLEQALVNLRDRSLLNELKTFDGCFMIRSVRGTVNSTSTHSYGLAIDLNGKENGLGMIPKLTPEFVKCFTDAGWTWGGNFKRKDGMHFSCKAWE